MKRAALITSLAIASLHAAGPARAETVNCTNITSLPATLTTQGVYCLKQDLATAVGSGSAITIATNNVTLDCNGYKIGGLAAGMGTQAAGIRAVNRLNATIRNCSLRGFMVGIELSGGGGHAVEDNRLDGSTGTGIVVIGDGVLVARNRVFDTGGMPNSFFLTSGIYVAGSVDVIDNTVASVHGTAGSNQPAAGIGLEGIHDGVVHRNRVRDIVGAGSGYSVGILLQNSTRASIRENHLSSAGNGTGVECSSNKAVLGRNHILGFTTSAAGCGLDAGNLVN